MSVQAVRTTQYDAGSAAGSVIGQQPTAETRLDPCQGEVILTISIGPESTIVPTVASPTATPTQLALPSPTNDNRFDNRLFWDDFETVPKPEWDFRGSSYSLVNGELAVEGNFTASVGDETWSNYRVEIDDWERNHNLSFRIRIRVQDENNFIELRGEGRGRFPVWYVVVEGEYWEVPNSKTALGRDISIEVEGPEYRFFRTRANREELVLRFVDDTYLSGRDLDYQSKRQEYEHR